MSFSMNRPPSDEQLELLLQQAQHAGVWRRRCSGKDVLTAECAELAGGLWARAFPTLKSLLKANQIAPQMHKLGIHVSALTGDHRDTITGREETRDELAAEMITARLEPFLEDVVTRRGWHRGESALATYFVNGCLLSYPSIYRRWARQRLDITNNIDFAAVQEVRRDVSLQIADRDVIRKLLEKAPRPVRPILSQLWLGYTQREIADQLGISPGTVANRLYQFRRKYVIPKVVRRHLEPPEGHLPNTPRLPREPDELSKPSMESVLAELLR